MKFHVTSLSAVVLLALAVSGCGQSSNEMRQPFGQQPADLNPPAAGYMVQPNYPSAGSSIAPTPKGGNSTAGAPVISLQNGPDAAAATLRDQERSGYFPYAGAPLTAPTPGYR